MRRDILALAILVLVAACGWYGDRQSDGPEIFLVNVPSGMCIVDDNGQWAYVPCETNPV